MNAKMNRHARATRTVTAVVISALTLTVVAAILTTVTAEAATTGVAPFRNQLAEGVAAVKVATAAETLTGATPHELTATPIAPPAPTVTRTTTRRTTSTSSTGTATSSGDAQTILNGLIARYPILAGTTVEYGDARGSQAIAYYKSGRIVISPDHTASLTRILNHEVWHIIDWRDNGVIDWGENVPPQ